MFNTAKFAIATAIGYPSAANEAQMVLHHGGKFALDKLLAVCTPGSWLEAQRVTESVFIAPPVVAYAVELCRASRSTPGVRLGASPRAAIWLIRSAQAHAVLSGRNFVAPGDVKAVAVGCLAHRLITDDGDDSIEATVRIVHGLLEATPTPRP